MTMTVQSLMYGSLIDKLRQGDVVKIREDKQYRRP
jgi:hypothetical protein